LEVVTEVWEIPNPDGYVYDIEVADNHNFLCDTLGGPIVHNCHHICSRTFSKALWKVATKKSLGLSATPHRKDGLTKVLEWFLGPILTFTNGSNGVQKPMVRFLNAEYAKPPTIRYNFRDQIVLPTLLTDLAADPTRNGQIVGEIRRCLAEGRKILVLSERRRQCEILKELLEGAESTVGLYLGGMTEAELQSANEKDVILATYNMAAEGYDCSTLDTLVMATSRSDIEQSVGRILRKPNSNLPLIIDVVDEMLSGQATRRRRYYRKCGFTIEGPKGPKGGTKEIVTEFAFLDP
jgi:superfamily II DNA or RNA helicase